MQGGSSPITDWIKSDVKTANTVSIIMIIFAAWAGIEAVSNLAGIEIPPETGMATNIDPDDTQRTNNGVIVGLGAVLGTLGIVIQSLIPRGEEEPEERGPVFDDELVKLTKWLCSRGTTTAQFFDWADVDNSGSIDMVEFANALRAAELANLPPWEIEDLVKLMDINSDGRIDLPELDIALLNIRNALGIEFVPYVEEEKQEKKPLIIPRKRLKKKLQKKSKQRMSLIPMRKSSKILQNPKKKLRKKSKQRMNLIPIRKSSKILQNPKKKLQKKSKQRMNLIPMRKSSKILQNQWMIQQPLKMKI